MFSEKYRFEDIDPKYSHLKKIFGSLDGIDWVRESVEDTKSSPQPYVIKTHPLANYGNHLFAYACVGKVGVLSEEYKQALRKTRKGRSKLRRMGKPEYRCLMWYLKPWDLTRENWEKYNKTPFVPMRPEGNIPNRVSIERILSFFPPIQETGTQS